MRHIYSTLHICILLFSTLIGLVGSSFAPHGDLHEQIEKVSKQIEADPTNADLYFQRGQLYHRHEDYENSEMDYLYVLDLDSTRCITNLALSELYLSMGQVDDGLVRVEAYLACEPGNNRARLINARLLHYAGRNTEAVPIYEDVLKGAEHIVPEYYFEIAEAILAADTTDYERALAWLEIGITRLNHPIQLEIAALELETKAGLYDQALTRCNRLMAPMARKEKWYERKGDIQAAAGRPAAAQESYRLALGVIEQLPVNRRNVPAMLQLKDDITQKLTQYQINTDP